MKTKKLLCIICTSLLLSSCASNKAFVVKSASIDKYKYAYITPTQVLVSDYGYMSVNPSDVITGKLIKEGYIILPELNPEKYNETMIVNYGEFRKSNSRKQEIIIQCISAETNEIICSSTAGGKRRMKAKDIRKSIINALYGLFPMK